MNLHRLSGIMAGALIMGSAAFGDEPKPTSTFALKADSTHTVQPIMNGAESAIVIESATIGRKQRHRVRELAPPVIGSRRAFHLPDGFGSVTSREYRYESTIRDFRYVPLSSQRMLPGDDVGKRETLFCFPERTNGWWVQKR